MTFQAQRTEFGRKWSDTSCIVMLIFRLFFCLFVWKSGRVPWLLHLDPSQILRSWVATSNPIYVRGGRAV